MPKRLFLLRIFEPTLSWEANLPLFVAMLSLPDVAVRGTDRKVAPLILHIICCILLVSLASDWKLSIGKTRGFAKEPSWHCKTLLFTTPPEKQKEGGGTRMEEGTKGGTKVRRRGGKWPGHREKEKDGEEQDRKKERKE